MQRDVGESEGSMSAKVQQLRPLPSTGSAPRVSLAEPPPTRPQIRVSANLADDVDAAGRALQEDPDVYSRDRRSLLPE